MRPVPEARHLVAVLILAAVAAAEGYFASLDDRLSDAQVNIASAAIKRQQPDSFPNDPIFGERQFWRFHTPAFQSLLEIVLVPTGYQDPYLPFRAMAGVLTMIFLCGMYALLYAQCRSWSVSAFVAVLSSRVIETLGGGLWGVGSLESVTPPGLCLAVTPLIVLAFARYAQPQADQSPTTQWRLLLVFAAVGLMGNFHLVTAMNVTIVLLIAYVGWQRFSPRCLPMAVGCGLCALVAALPYAWYYFSLRAAMSRWDPEPAAASIYQAFRIGQLAVLYPELLKDLLDWRILIGALVLVVPAAAVLCRVERFRGQNLGLWVCLAGGSVFTALGLHGISQLVGWGLGVAPPVIDFLQAAGLLMLPLYVLLAQAITNLFRLLRAHRRLVRWACAILLAAWMVPSDNLRVARWAAGELATAFMEEADKPAYVLRHKEQEARGAELEAIAKWAAGRKGAIYITDRAEFRVLAHSPIIAGPNDARYLYYLAPGRLGAWVRHYQRQKRLLTGRADGDTLAQFVADLIQEDPSLKAVTEWYAVLRAADAPAKTGALQVVENDAWGRHYRLYRVR
jgi:hypothetical protein